MLPRRMISLLSLIGTLAVPRASAQGPSIDTGSRIRFVLDLPVPRRFTGTVLALTSDSIFLVPAHHADTVVVPLGSIRRLERRVPLSTLRRVVAGGAAGSSLAGLPIVVVFFANGCLSWTSYSHHNCPSDRTAVGAMLLGGAVGAIIGASVRWEHWVRVPQARVHASLSPSGVRIAIGF